MAVQILEQIIADKRKDLAQLKQNYPINGARSRRKMRIETVIEILQRQRLIAEVKRASPSMGAIDLNVDYVQQAKNYEAGGAGMISVLTDERHFAGSFAFLEEIGQQVDCPLLCKDFIIDEWQLDAAEFAGADAVLLIVSCFDQEGDEKGPFCQGPERLQHLYHYALVKGLLPLVEIYGSQERYAAYQLQPYLLGVNSRNLQTMEIDLAQGAQTLALLRRELSMPQACAVRAQAGLPELPLFVGESGIFEPEDARVWAQGGADCLLVGTSLMLAGKQNGLEQIGQRITAFANALNL